MPNCFNFLKKQIRFCPFLTIDAVVCPQLRSYEIVDPRNLNDSTCLTTVLIIKSGTISFLCFRKSIVISQVLETFNTRFFFLRQPTTCFKYLGSTTDRRGGASKDVDNRVTKASSKWRELTGVICDKKIPAKLKLLISDSD